MCPCLPLTVVLQRRYGMMIQVRRAISNKYGATKGQNMSLKRSSWGGKLRKQDIKDNATVYCEYAVRGAVAAAKRARRRSYADLYPSAHGD
jgi:hypothetical protein